MSNYNYIDLEDVRCPRCDVLLPTIETEARVGWLRLTRYRLGDTIVWAMKSAQGRCAPIAGTVTSTRTRSALRVRRTSG